MSARTGIGWTDASWNPWHGCTKVSPGCKHCYMFRDKKRYGQDPTRVVRSNESTFRAPLRWTESARIFTCSWSDFFHPDADTWRHEAWGIIGCTPHHTYQILTKRPERIQQCLPHSWGLDGWPNVWLGVSVESDEYEWRIHALGEVAARRRFISAEPLIGPWDITPHTLRGNGIHWVIVGGESGPFGKRREMKMDWLDQVQHSATHAGAALFVKQDSGSRASQQGRIPDHLWARKEFPLSPRIQP